MLNKETITGLKYTMHPSYQYVINSHANLILGNANSISIGMLKINNIFTQLLDKLDEKTKKSLYERIENFAGKNINQNELRTLLILLDAELKKEEDQSEHFVMDVEYNINSKSGIFQATKEEWDGLSKIVSVFDFSNKDNTFPHLQKDGTYQFYKMKNNNFWLYNSIKTFKSL